jgi:predicted TIM-barrel fold metal-dependent hydrolase
MHAAWPLVDAMIAMLHSHPQLYVDTGVISWAAPRGEFYRHLRRLIESGNAGRVMFGSDQMAWPDAIPIAIDAIESAPFLSAAQKRDILYNNAARFFRLDRAATTTARQPGR